MVVNGEVLAELEIWHTRPFTPTRRLSLGALDLPVDHSPGFGGLLLGGIVANDPEEAVYIVAHTDAEGLLLIIMPPDQLAGLETVVARVAEGDSPNLLR